MLCTVAADGGLVDCKVTEESPIAVGFGEALLKMAPFFKMRPLTRNGQPVDGGTVRIPVRFLLPGGGATDPLSAMLGCYGQTAAAAEADPSNAEMIQAYSFFAG